VTRLRAGRYGVGLPAKEIVFSPENFQAGSAAHPASYSVSSLVLSPGGNPVSG